MRLYSLRGSIGSWLFLMLFALPFGGVGVFMTVWMWRDVNRSREIQAKWIAVPAKIESAELKTSRGSKGGTTYEAVGSFSYVYEGKSYHGEQVGLSGGFDNVGSFQQNVHREMKTALRSGRTMEVRVNPANPSEAVLKPEWRPEMTLFRALFGLVFGGFGLGMLGGGLASLVKSAGDGRLKKRYPQEPWLWRSIWQTPSQQAQLGVGLFAAAAVLIWVNVATWPLWSAVPSVWAAGGAFKWVLSGALAVIVLISAICVRVIIHARKYRGARLDVGSLPLRPGAPVEARLYLPQALPIGAILKLTLISERSVTTGRGKQRRTDKTTLWSHSEEHPGPIAPGQEIVLRCRLPADAEQTTTEPPENTLAWRVEARAKVPGVDLKLNFELPVFGGPRAS